MALDHSCQVQRRTLADRGHDFYETPAVAVEALLRVEQIPHRIWEPCAGRGAIVGVLRAHGREVIAIDLIDYGIAGQAHGRDFLLEHKAPEGIECILTNPPYKLADQLVEHALKLCPKVTMLLRLALLVSERRCGILDGAGLKRVLAFRKRLPMTHRRGWEGRKANSGMAFAWFVWDRAHLGPPALNRIDWTALPAIPPAASSGVATKGTLRPGEGHVFAVKGVDRSAPTMED